MPNWLIALFFGIGLGGWVYAKLVRANGNPTPGQDLTGAAIAGALGFIVIWTLFEFVFDF